MKLGYNTNGLAHHDPEQGLELLAELGYRSIALTLDHGWLNPYSDDFHRQLTRIARCLQRYQLASVIETGARFLLDPRRKHEPTLVSPAAEARAMRVDFLCRAIDIASELGSDCVSFWSGVVHDGASRATALERLVESILPVVKYAEQRQVTIGFEPEPGMLIDTMAGFDELQTQITAAHFQLTLDLGHLHCQGEVPVADFIRRYGHQIVNTHWEDMKAGVHEHLMFGEGEMEFCAPLAALAEVNYRGGLHVELSRHSHDAVNAARRSYDFLTAALRGL
ncbi:MAG: sugar phosphate isomerase/epimerase family protein [Planctomycetota bacterium]